jgi:Protein of unknown function (DUF2505)
MRLSTEIDYPGADTSAVFAMVSDRGFREAVCAATGALEYDVDVALDDDGTGGITVTRTHPAEVPDFVKKFVGQTLTLVQSETWGPPRADGGRTADLVISVKGQPASMKGSVTLETTDSGSRELIDGDLLVSVPFIGKKIEPELAKAIVAAAAKEQQTGRTWLTRSP